MVRDWAVEEAIQAHRISILDALDLFSSHFIEHQQPFLMQPVWKTKGKSPELSEQAFDIFVWSDLSLCRAFIEIARADTKESRTISRHFRSCARMLRCLYELTTAEKSHITPIYRGMSLGNQTDKEFALNGRVTNRYMRCGRLSRPAVPASALTQIIQGGGEKLLSPERRFDATIFFTARHLFETEHDL